MKDLYPIIFVVGAVSGSRNVQCVNNAIEECLVTIKECANQNLSFDFKVNVLTATKPVKWVFDKLTTIDELEWKDVDFGNDASINDLLTALDIELNSVRKQLATDIDDCFTVAPRIVFIVSEYEQQDFTPFLSTLKEENCCYANSCIIGVANDIVDENKKSDLIDVLEKITGTLEAVVKINELGKWSERIFKPCPSGSVLSWINEEEHISKDDRSQYCYDLGDLKIGENVLYRCQFLRTTPERALEEVYSVSCYNNGGLCIKNIGNYYKRINATFKGKIDFEYICDYDFSCPNVQIELNFNLDEQDMLDVTIKYIKFEETTYSCEPYWNEDDCVTWDYGGPIECCIVNYKPSLIIKTPARVIEVLNEKSIVDIPYCEFRVSAKEDALNNLAIVNIDKGIIINFLHSGMLHIDLKSGSSVYFSEIENVVLHTGDVKIENNMDGRSQCISHTCESFITLKNQWQDELIWGDPREDSKEYTPLTLSAPMDTPTDDVIDTIW